MHIISIKRIFVNRCKQKFTSFALECAKTHKFKQRASRHTRFALCFRSCVFGNTVKMYRFFYLGTVDVRTSFCSSPTRSFKCLNLVFTYIRLKKTSVRSLRRFKVVFNRVYRLRSPVSIAEKARDRSQILIIKKVLCIFHSV